MSVITKIEVQKNNKDRVNLYIDDAFYTGMNIEVVMKHQLKKGMDISEDLLEKIIFDDVKGEAFNKAIKYIGSSLKSVKQIKDYLKKKEYSDEVVCLVIDKLCEYKYVDDYEFAKSFVLTYSKKYGKLKIVSMLKSKGVEDNIIDDVFEEEKLESNIERVARKYLGSKQINNETWLKLNRFLYSRGYDFEEIGRIISKLKDELC
ncbi:MAG: hypothetical protein E7345_03775 [Clostridiales bacterium]|nr:hypothetical protein [Clostridiales bacterium]